MHGHVPITGCLLDVLYDPVGAHSVYGISYMAISPCCWLTALSTAAGGDHAHATVLIMLMLILMPMCPLLSSTGVGREAHL